MACSIPYLPLKIRFSTCSLCSSTASVPFLKTFTATFSCRSHLSSTKSIPSASLSTTASFTWNDVIRISQPESAPDDPSDLKPYFDKIQACNRGSVSYKFSHLPNTTFVHFFFFPAYIFLVSQTLLSFSLSYWNRLQEFQSEFLPFIIENQIVGYIHNG